MVVSEPLNARPMGERAVATMTASGIDFSSSQDVLRLYARAPAEGPGLGVGGPCHSSGMASWSEIEAAEPAFAARVRRAVRCREAQDDRHRARRWRAAHLRHRGRVRRWRAHLRLDAARAQGCRSAPRSPFRPAQRVGGTAGGPGGPVGGRCQGRRARGARGADRGRGCGGRALTAPICARWCSPASTPRPRPCGSSGGRRSAGCAASSGNEVGLLSPVRPAVRRAGP